MGNDPLFSIEEICPIDIQDGYIIEGFPSNDLESAVAVEAFRKRLEFNEIAELHSSLFPNETHSKILSTTGYNFAVISSLMRLTRSHYKQLADTVLKFAREHGVKYIFTCQIIDAHKSVGTVNIASTDDAKQKTDRVHYSSAEIADRITDAEIDIKITRPVTADGIITGFPAVLINQGIENNQDVIAILTNKNHDFIDNEPITELCNRLSIMTRSISKSNDPYLEWPDESINNYQTSVEGRVERFTSLDRSIEQIFRFSDPHSILSRRVC